MKLGAVIVLQFASIDIRNNNDIVAKTIEQNILTLEFVGELIEIENYLQ